MKTVRLTTAQAIVRYLVAQRTVLDGEEAPLVPRRVRHLRARQRARPRQRPPRGAGAAAHLARPERAGDGARRGRLREGDAAAADHGRDLVDRPRRAEHGHRGRRRARQPPPGAPPRRRHVPEPHPRPGAPAGRALRLALDDGQRRLPAVTRYWDRITRPEQVVQSLPLAVETMLDPADCGPAFIGLPQDVQAEAYDYPAASSSPACTSCAGRADRPSARRRRRGLRRAQRRSSSPAAACTTRSPRTSSRASPRRTASRSSRPSPASPASADHPPRRADRRHRRRPRQPARRRGRPRPRRRHPAAGLHHRLVDGVPRGRLDRRDQRGPLRRRQAPRPAGRRRRARGARRARARLAGWRRGRRVDARAWPRRPLSPRSSQRRRRRRHGRADLRPGDRRRQPAAGPTTTPSRPPPAASPAS